MTSTDFAIWNAEVDRLAKFMKPTKNGAVTAKTFMEAVANVFRANVFRANGWDFSAYIEHGIRMYYERSAMEKRTV